MATRSVTKRAAIVLMFFLFVSINILGQNDQAQELYVNFDEHGGRYRIQKITSSKTIRFCFGFGRSYYCFENYPQKYKKMLVDADEVAKMKFLAPNDIDNKYWEFKFVQRNESSDSKEIDKKRIRSKDFNPVFIIEYDKTNNQFYKYRVFYQSLFPW